MDNRQKTLRSQRLFEFASLWILLVPGLTAFAQAPRPPGQFFLTEEAKSANRVDPDGTTALHWAAQREQSDKVNALISAGANVNAGNRYGVTPLLLAVTTGNAPITQALLKPARTFAQ